MLGIDNYVPLSKQNFEIRIYNMDGTTPAEFSDLLTLSTKNVGQIGESQDALPVHYGNGLIKFPGKVEYDDVVHSPHSCSVRTGMSSSWV